MKIENILKKYNIKIDKIGFGYEPVKLKSSKEITFIGNKYFLDLSKFKDGFDIDLFTTIDDNDLYENMYSLEIEGIKTSKAVSSRALKVSNKLNSDGLVNIGNKLNIINIIDKEYDSMDKNIKPSKINFYRDTGINLALSKVIDQDFDLSIKENIKFTYDLLTLFNNALEKNDKLEKDSIYRKGEVNITDGYKIIDKGIPSKDVEKQMNKLLSMFNSEYELNNLLFSSIIHYLFIEIHPYYDGNGRMARLMIKAIANKEDSDGLWAKHMNKIILWLQSSYNKSISLSRKTKDLTFFLSFMDFVYNSSFFTELVISEENKRLISKKKSVNGLQPTILCYFIIQQRFISWKDIKKDVVGAKELTEQRIKQILNEMVENKLLEKDKMDNNNVFVLSKRIIQKQKEQT